MTADPYQSRIARIRYDTHRAAASEMFRSTYIALLVVLLVSLTIADRFGNIVNRLDVVEAYEAVRESDGTANWYVGILYFVFYISFVFLCL